MSLFSRKPSTAGAIELMASQVYHMRLGGQDYRLAGLVDPYTDLKVKPHQGKWPLIISMEEVEDYPHVEPHSVVYATEGEDLLGRPWYFSDSALLSVIPEEA